MLYHVKFEGHPVDDHDWFDQSGLKRSREVLQRYRDQFGTNMPEFYGNVDGKPEYASECVDEGE